MTPTIRRCLAARPVLVAIVALAGMLVAAVAHAGEPNTPTLLIVNARIVDGTGTPARAGAVRIAGDRIAAVGELAPQPGEPTFDAGGRVLAPGFVDTHSHHDDGLFDQRDAPTAVSQGITTIVVGLDGWLQYPLKYLYGRLGKEPAAVNVAAFVGHGQLRTAAMGADAARPATPREIERMRRLLREGLRAGALGLSTGLEYDPGVYSTTEEVIELAREAARAGGLYASHIRSEDRRLWESLDEFVRIGREAQVPIHLSHAKLAQTDWWGQADRMLAVLERARAAGVRVSADVYPYQYWQSTLAILFPERNFTDRAAAEFALAKLAPADGLRLSRFRPDPSLVGRTVAEIAKARGTDEVSTLLALVAEVGDPDADDAAMVIGTSMADADVATLLAAPHVNVCSDGMLVDRHPRGAGSFTRVLGHYVRERGVLPLEAAIHKMTALSAANVGLRDRGTIRAGAYADLVLLDPATVTDRATIAAPLERSVGIERVWVNGAVVYERGRTTGATPGRVLRRPTAEPQSR